MRSCPACGVEVEVVDGGIYRPVNKKLLASLPSFKIPFYCSVCDSIKFPYKAVRDVVFLYPTPRPEKVGNVYIPDYDGRSYNTRELFRESSGIILSIGPGAIHKKTKKFFSTKDLEVGDYVYYNKSVPWKLDVIGIDGGKYRVIICGYLDIYAKMEELDGRPIEEVAKS